MIGNVSCYSDEYYLTQAGFLAFDEEQVHVSCLDRKNIGQNFRRGHSFEKHIVRSLSQPQRFILRCTECIECVVKTHLTFYVLAWVSENNFQSPS
jgi:hypothetical protein